jgi:hypothetical protein
MYKREKREYHENGHQNESVHIIVCGDFKVSEMSSAAQYLLWDDCSLMDKVRGVFSGKCYMYHLPCSIQLILAGIDVLGAAPSQMPVKSHSPMVYLIYAHV